LASETAIYQVPIGKYLGIVRDGAVEYFQMSGFVTTVSPPFVRLQPVTATGQVVMRDVIQRWWATELLPFHPRLVTLDAGLEEPKTILVVEDETRTRLVINTDLRRRYPHAKITLARDLADARGEWASAGPFDRVVTGDYLRDGWGTEFAKEIWVRHPTTTILLIAWTALSDVPHLEAFRAQHRPIEVLEKPYGDESFAQALTALDQRATAGLEEPPKVRMEALVNGALALTSPWRQNTYTSIDRAISHYATMTSSFSPSDQRLAAGLLGSLLNLSPAASAITAEQQTLGLWALPVIVAVADRFERAPFGQIPDDELLTAAKAILTEEKDLVHAFKVGISFAERQALRRRSLPDDILLGLIRTAKRLVLEGPAAGLEEPPGTSETDAPGEGVQLIPRLSGAVRYSFEADGAHSLILPGVAGRQSIVPLTTAQSKAFLTAADRLETVKATAGSTAPAFTYAYALIGAGIRVAPWL